MEFKQFTSNGWIDESKHFVIVANFDTKKFQVRYYENEFELNSLLLGKASAYKDLGEYDNDTDAVNAAKNYFKDSTSDSFVNKLKEYAPGLSDELYQKIIKIIDIIKGS